MSDFTGGDPMQVHHLPRDPEFLIELPEQVQVPDVGVTTMVRREDASNKFG